MNLHRIVYQDRAGKNSVRWAVSVGERDELIRQIAKGKGRVLLEGLVEIPKGRPAMARFLNMFAGNIVFSIEEGEENDKSRKD
jgi:hypothetical protein